MIHLGNASPTVSTVVRPRWLWRRAFITPSSLGFNDLLLKYVSAGVDCNCFVVCIPQRKKQDVESDRLAFRRSAGFEGGVMEEELRKVAKEGY